MRRVSALLLVCLLLAPSGASVEAAKLRVVATIPDLKALTEAVGGDRVEVDALARGTQNPHDLEIRPSLMVKLRRADAVVVNGLELDGWADVAIHSSNNGRIIPGAPGHIDASRGIQPLEVPTGHIDRSMGDVHPLGNPHYTLDPGQAPAITATILDGLARLAPDHRAAFERNRQAFLARLEQAMARWSGTMAPLRGAKAVAYHNDWIYLFTRFGITQVGTIEERPGIPASPAHLARLIRTMKEQGVKAVIVEPWSDQQLAARVAREAGARVVALNAKLGQTSGPDAYIASTDANIAALAAALKSAP
jgi:zinc/manganese transport system substrate-binding protein